MPFIENFEEFRIRQKCECLPVRDRYLFANGAQSNGDLSHCDPPEDPNEALKLRHEFVKAKLARKVDQYNRERNTVSTQAYYHKIGAGPSVESALPDWKEVLKELQTEIEQLKQQEEELRQQLPQSQCWIAIKNRQREEARAAARAERELTEFPNYSNY